MADCAELNYIYLYPSAVPLHFCMKDSAPGALPQFRTGDSVEFLLYYCTQHSAGL